MNPKEAIEIAQKYVRNQQRLDGMNFKKEKTMDRRINRITAQEYMKIAPQLEEASHKASTASFEARPCFSVYSDTGVPEKFDCSVADSSVAGAVLQMNGYIGIKTVPEFLGWLRDVFPEEFKKVVEGG